MKKAIELTELVNTKGIQVQIVGRIDGKEIAYVEWIKEGVAVIGAVATVAVAYSVYRSLQSLLGILSSNEFWTD
ncbi:hypothetical protein LWI28_004306 [Acer negundo]|uniref:Uncharacterized protein n=1 Tax=Acer negundo TaxID=4023 RepID=A0AAD5JJ61_ACENE|nr:hypothetical protein LWI28_004306 [Acer negundo]